MIVEIVKIEKEVEIVEIVKVLRKVKIVCEDNKGGIGSEDRVIEIEM